MLDPNALQNLFNEEGFSELRIKCYKLWHGRTLHVVLSGDKIHQWVDKKQHYYGVCGDVRFLSDDNSQISHMPCQRYRIGYSIYLYYRFTFWIHSTTHVGFDKNGNRCDCDDKIVDSNYERIGEWQFYIR